MLPRIAPSVGLFGILALLPLLLSLLSAAAGAGDELFTISIDVGGAEPEELAVREGAVPSQLAKSFADKHGLNDHGAPRLPPHPHTPGSARPAPPVPRTHTVHTSSWRTAVGS